LQIYLIYLCIGGVSHTIGKILTRATTFLLTSSQSEVCTRSYGPPKSWKSQFREFRDSNLRVPGQNDIWVLVLCLATKNTIRGKVVASPKFGSWWVLWIRVCSWLVHAPKVLQLCTTNLFGLCKSVWVIKSFVIRPSSILELQHALLPPKCYEPKIAPQLLIISLSSLLDS